MAAADSRSQSSQPSQKKVLKKLHRKQELFLKAEPECGVQFVSTSSRFVFVGNGGLKNGLSRDLLTALLHSGNHSEGLLQVHLYPGKDYSFCTFKEVENATVTVAALNGVCVQDVCKRYNMQHLLSPVLSSGPPLHLYLSFVDRLPSDSAVTTAPSGLCQAANQLPPGLILIPDFISCEEEGRFIDFFVISEDKMTKFVANEDAAAVPQEMLKHRSVKHYGYEFLYGSNSVDPEHPLPGGLPAICTALLERILEAGLVAHPPDQLTVNQYLPGSGIPPHVDTHSAFEDGIISIALGSHTVMDFRHPDGRKISVFLQRRSLLVMKGESRYLWTHGITGRKSDTVTSQTLGYWKQENEPLKEPPEQQDSPLTQSPLLMVGGRTDTCQVGHDQVTTVVPRGTRISLTFRKIKRESCTCELCGKVHKSQ